MSFFLNLFNVSTIIKQKGYNSVLLFIIIIAYRGTTDGLVKIHIYETYGLVVTNLYT